MYCITTSTKLPIFAHVNKTGHVQNRRSNLFQNQYELYLHEYSTDIRISVLTHSVFYVRVTIPPFSNIKIPM